MKKFLKLAMAALCAMTLSCMVGCGGSNSPKGIVKDVLQTQKDGKIDMAYIEAHFSKAMLDDIKGRPEEVQQLAIAAMNQGLESFSVGDVEEKGDVAWVAVKVKMKGEAEIEDKVPVVKENGEWKFGDPSPEAAPAPTAASAPKAPVMTPAKVVEGFFATLKAGMIDQAYIEANCSAESVRMFKELPATEIAEMNQMGSMYGEVKILSVEENGDTAVVEFVMQAGGASKTDKVKLVKEDGRWKLIME